MENKYIERMNTHYVRFIESWRKTCRRKGIFSKYSDKQLFKEWLENLTLFGEELTQDEITDILCIYECGKMELEHSAENFLKEKCLW